MLTTVISNGDFVEDLPDNCGWVWHYFRTEEEKEFLKGLKALRLWQRGVLLSKDVLLGLVQLVDDIGLWLMRIFNILYIYLLCSWKFFINNICNSFFVKHGSKLNLSFLFIFLIFISHHPPSLPLIHSFSLCGGPSPVAAEGWAIAATRQGLASDAGG